jgi:hypothetical protein
MKEYELLKRDMKYEKERKIRIDKLKKNCYTILENL